MVYLGSADSQSDQQERDFLNILRETGNVTRAAELAGLERSYLYRLRNANAKFRRHWQEALDQALDQALDHLEAGLLVKALGSHRLGSDQSDPENAPVMDDKTAIFLLKAHRPEIFGDGKKRQASGDKAKARSPRKKLLTKLNRLKARNIDEKPEAGSETPEISESAETPEISEIPETAEHGRKDCRAGQPDALPGSAGLK